MSASYFRIYVLVWRGRLELELEGQLHRAWAADLAEGVEAAVGAAGAEAARQRFVSSSLTAG